MSILFLLQFLSHLSLAGASAEVETFRGCVLSLQAEKKELLENAFIRTFSQVDPNLAAYLLEVEAFNDSLGTLERTQPTARDSRFSYLASNANDSCLAYHAKMGGYLNHMIKFWGILALTSLLLVAYYLYIVMVLFKRVDRDRS